MVLDHYLIPESLETLPRYPTAAFHTEGSSTNPHGAVVPSKKVERARDKGGRLTHWNPGPHTLLSPVPAAHCVIPGSLVPSEHRIDTLSGTDVGSHVHRSTLGLPGFFSLYMAVFI